MRDRPHPLSSFDTHAKWQPVTHSARTRQSYAKIEDCEQSKPQRTSVRRLMSTPITNKQRREIVHQEYIFISRQVRGNRLLIHDKTSQFPPLVNCYIAVELIGYTCVRKLDNTVGSNA